MMMMMHRTLGIITLISGVAMVLIGVVWDIIWTNIVGALLVMAGAGITVWGATHGEK